MADFDKLLAVYAADSGSSSFLRKYGWIILLAMVTAAIGTYYAVSTDIKETAVLENIIDNEPAKRHCAFFAN